MKKRYLTLNCLLDNDLKELRLHGIMFIQEDERLDDFYFKKLNAGNYRELSFVIGSP